MIIVLFFLLKNKNNTYQEKTPIWRYLSSSLLFERTATLPLDHLSKIDAHSHSTSPCVWRCDVQMRENPSRQHCLQCKKRYFLEKVSKSIN